MAKTYTFEQLQKIETEVNKIAYNSRDIQKLWENNNSRLNKLRNHWEIAIEQLRGWGEWEKPGQETKVEWLEYCKENGLNPYYDFNDCMA